MGAGGGTGSGDTGFVSTPGSRAALTPSILIPLLGTGHCHGEVDDLSPPSWVVACVPLSRFVNVSRKGQESFKPK